MDANTQRAEAERWLGIAAKLLTARDFLGSKTFAIRARESDPNNVISDHILAVVDTLLAAEEKINSQYDWYAILQLAHLVRDPEIIATQYRRLVLLLNPESNRLPFADYALRLVVDAWSVLSDPTKKWLYDSELSLYLQRLDSHRLDSVRVDPDHLNTFQFFQQPQTQQQQLLPQWQQQPQQFEERHQNQQLLQFQEQRQQHQLQEMWPQQHRQQERQQQREQQLLEPQESQQQQPQLQSQQHQHREWPREFLQPLPRPHQEQQIQSQPTQPSEMQTSQENASEGNAGTATHSNENANNNNVDVPSFWTACPYCLYIYEYPEIYQDCPLRCQNCRRAFHAQQISNPPPISNKSGEDSSFCSWGFFPLGFSMRKWKNSNQVGNRTGFFNWVPFSPMFVCPVNGSGTAGGYVYPVGGSKNLGRKSGGTASESRFCVDDDDMLLDVSDTSDDSDDDWRSTKKPKVKKAWRRGKRGRPPKAARESKGNESLVAEGGVTGGENFQVKSEAQLNVAPLVAGAKTDLSRKAVSNNLRKQTGRVAKDRGKLDLNVEFSNEVEENTTTMSAGNGQEEPIEGIAFFEGLDEFLSSLPILNVVGDEKVKPS
ncbi:hypothetical protein Nepgr_025518 [Nepenthes gracilis]|uniref:J domain-containing protein n=1 Tax=Nepenthes gracilis TaxID=150966 RepID=A0AAD3T596_NEPGR|nr:hypothetical protein Nepgr_025518 [Nepenthes gracilis]